MTTTIQAKLTEDKSIDTVLTLGAQFALDAVKAVEASGSAAKIGTFDTNKELVAAIKDGKVGFAIDQQPYLQGYLATTPSGCSRPTATPSAAEATSRRGRPSSTAATSIRSRSSPPTGTR